MIQASTIFPAATAMEQDGIMINPGGACLVQLGNALGGIFMDEAVSDCVFEVQGRQFPVVKAILAARSPYFRALLYGEFRESKRCKTEGVIQLPDTSAASFYSLLEYMYTATSKALVLSDDLSQTLDLLQVADKFGVTCLVELLCHALLPFMKPIHAAGVYAVTQNLSGAHAPIAQLTASAKRMVLAQPHESLVSSQGVLALNSSSLEGLLQDATTSGVLANEGLFRALQIWVTHQQRELEEAMHTNIETHNNSEVVQVFTQQEADLKVLVNRLSLMFTYEFMSPSFLKLVVAPSGLVSQTRLFDACLCQAIAAERNSPFNTSTSQLCWASTASSGGSGTFRETSAHHRSEITVSPISLPGIHSWTVTIDKVCSLTWVGLAAGVIDTEQWLGKQPGGYVFGNNGSFCHATGIDNGPYESTKVCPHGFEEGAVFHMQLYLPHTHGEEKFTIIREATQSKDSTGGGSSTDSVDQVIVEVTLDRKGPYFPAVSLRTGGAVTIGNYSWSKI